MECRGGEVALEPGVVLEVEIYSDEQIAEWDAADRLGEEERERTLEAVSSPRCSPQRTSPGT